jgi:hypothetical protein
MKYIFEPRKVMTLPDFIAELTGRRPRTVPELWHAIIAPWNAQAAKAERAGQDAPARPEVTFADLCAEVRNMAAAGRLRHVPENVDGWSVSAWAKAE